MRPRGLSLALLSLGVSLLSGCGSFWPWSSSAPAAKPLELPAVTSPVASKLLWSHAIGKSERGFLPAFAGDSIYAAALDGTVVRLDAASGRVRWSQRLADPIATGVAANEELVTLVTRKGNLLGLSAADGKELWSVSLGAEGATVPALAHGLVVIRTSDNRVSAFESDSGKKRWSILRQNPPLVLRQTNAPVVAAATVYAGLPGGKMIALSAQTGSVRWESTISQPRGATEIERIADVVGTPQLSARQICAATYRGAVTCLDVSTGRPEWSREIPAVAGIDVDARVVSAVDEKGHVHAYSRSGASLWKQEGLSGRSLTAPLSLGPVLVLADQQGFVHLLSRDDGAIAARFSTDGSAIVAAPVAAGRSALVQTSGGSLQVIALD